MVFRPRDLASRMAERRKPDDGYLREILQPAARSGPAAGAMISSSAIRRPPI